MSMSNLSACSYASGLELGSHPPTKSLGKMTAATVIHDVGHQALDLEQKARMMAEAARKEAESARNIAMEGQRDALNQLQREHRSRKEITEHKDAVLRELETARYKVTELGDKVTQLEVISQTVEEERNVAVQHRDIADSAREGAVAAKKRAYVDLDREKNAKQRISEKLNATQQALDDLQEAHDQEHRDHVESQKQLQSMAVELADERKQAASSGEQVTNLLRQTTQLQDSLSTAEEKLAAAEEKAEHYLFQMEIAKESALQARENCDVSVGKDRNRCKKAEIEVQEALKELARAEKRAQLAELSLDDMQCTLELEQKLRHQAASERDRMQALLKEQQTVTQQLERELSIASEALEATRCQLQEAVSAEHDASTMAATLTGDHLSRRELIDELQERLRDAESGRRVAEASWREAEDARQDAQNARREAERNWHHLSEMLERAEGARRDAIQALLSERSSRLLVQQTLEAVCDGLPLDRGLQQRARVTLLDEMRAEQRLLSYFMPALDEAATHHRGAMDHLAALSEQLGADREALLRGDQDDSSSDEAARLSYGKLQATSALADAAMQQAIMALSRARETAQQTQDHQHSSLKQLKASDALEQGDGDRTLELAVPSMLKQLMNGEAGRAHSDAGSDPDSHHGVLSDSEDAAGAQPAARALGDISNSASQTPVPVKGSSAYRLTDDNAPPSEGASSMLFTDEELENDSFSLRTPDTDSLRSPAPLDALTPGMP